MRSQVKFRPQKFTSSQKVLAAKNSRGTLSVNHSQFRCNQRTVDDTIALTNALCIAVANRCKHWLRTPLYKRGRQTTIARAACTEANRVIEDNTSCTSLPRSTRPLVLVRCITCAHTHTNETHFIINSGTHGSTLPSHSTTTINVRTAIPVPVPSLILHAAISFQSGYIMLQQ